ncbi:putative L-type lectin-domain containing receptor kinase, partial [Trifolium medium]|nr:putative L-type lectin-domain containing receptor kinase [Trifolium medium]
MKATGGFSLQNKLGEGGFGTVYKGILGNNKEIAVKRVSKNSRQGKQEFIAEVTTIGSLHHKNLVKLI